MMRGSIFCIILLLFSSILFSQDFNKEKLDQYFQTLEENNKFMGSVAVSKNGEIIYTNAIGFADIKNQIKPTINTKYRIGSISKSFTAVLVLKAVEDKKLDLKQTIHQWFPSITNADKITISQLLQHRSGIHNFTNDKDYLTYYTLPKTENEMLAIIENGGSDFEPNSKASYSNSNYVLLTYILEKIFEKPYAQLIEEYIANPIGLENTYVFGKINTLNNESKSYQFSQYWKEEPETDATIPLGAGALISTPSDLIKFAEALFGHNLISATSLE